MLEDGGATSGSSTGGGLAPTKRPHVTSFRLSHWCCLSLTFYSSHLLSPPRPLCLAVNSLTLSLPLVLLSPTSPLRCARRPRACIRVRFLSFVSCLCRPLSLTWAFCLLSPSISLSLSLLIPRTQLHLASASCYLLRSCSPSAPL